MSVKTKAAEDYLANLDKNRRYWKGVLVGDNEFIALLNAFYNGAHEMLNIILKENREGE